MLNQSDDNLNDTDYDLDGPCPQQSVDLVLGPYVHSIICLLGLVGNSLVIATYACYKRTKSMTDVYLLNVAVADLLFVAALPLIVYNELSSWSMGSVACKLLRGSYSVNLYSGMMLLACISTDRYVAIVQARRSFRLRSLPHSRFICAGVWAFALLVSVPTFHFYHRYEPSHSRDAMIDEYMNTTGPQYVCEFKFTDQTVAWRTKVAVPSTQLAVGFFLPLLVMVFCYSSVVVTLLRAKNFQRHKAVRVVLAVVAVFVLCHAPYNAVLFYETVHMFNLQSCEAVAALETSKMLTQTIAYLHCCLNPVLYAFVGVKFRNHFRRIVHDLWCLGKTHLTPRRFSRVTSDMYLSTRRSLDGSGPHESSFTM